jgi:hypothetical protein
MKTLTKELAKFWLLAYLLGLAANYFNPPQVNQGPLWLLTAYQWGEALVWNVIYMPGAFLLLAWAFATPLIFRGAAVTVGDSKLKLSILKASLSPTVIAIIYLLVVIFPTGSIPGFFLFLAFVSYRLFWFGIPWVFRKMNLQRAQVF